MSDEKGVVSGEITNNTQVSIFKSQTPVIYGYLFGY
jgi:hypothetical protein